MWSFCVSAIRFFLLLRILIGFVFVLVGGRMLARKQINKLPYNLYISSVYTSLSGHTTRIQLGPLSTILYAYAEYTILFIV
jgi:hypothetical protein